MEFKVESNLKKYSRLNGYTCRGYSAYSVLRHLSLKFNIAEYELKKAYQKNKISIRVEGI